MTFRNVSSEGKVIGRNNVWKNQQQVEENQ
jgi:hypothetical protein